MAATKKSTASKSKSKKTVAKKSTGAKKAGTGSRSSTANRSASKTSTAKKSTSKSTTAKKSTAKKSTAKKSASKAPAKKSAAKKTASARSGAARRSTASKSTTGRATAGSKATSKKTAAAKTTKSASKKTVNKSASKKATKKATQNRKQDGNGKSIVSSVMDRVTGLFGGKGTSAIELLKADHDKVEQMFEKVKANEDGDNKATFKKIKLELDTHTHIEETIFYPYLLEHGDDELEKIVREGIEEHRQAKMFLVELDELSGTSDDFKAKMKVLMEDIEHHVKEEENEMFKMVEEQVDREKLQELGAQMEAEKPEFQKNPTTENAPVRAAANG